MPFCELSLFQKRFKHARPAAAAAIWASEGTTFGGRTCRRRKTRLCKANVLPSPLSSMPPSTQALAQSGWPHKMAMSSKVRKEPPAVAEKNCKSTPASSAARILSRDSFQPSPGPWGRSKKNSPKWLSNSLGLQRPWPRGSKWRISCQSSNDFRNKACRKGTSSPYPWKPFTMRSWKLAPAHKAVLAAAHRSSFFQRSSLSNAHLALLGQVDGSFLVARQDGNIQQPCHRVRGPGPWNFHVTAANVQHGTGDRRGCCLSCCSNRTDKIHIPIFHPNALLHWKGPTATGTRVPTLAVARWIRGTSAEWSKVVVVFQDAARYTTHCQCRSGVDMSKPQAKIKQVHHAPLRSQQLTQFLLVSSLGSLEYKVQWIRKHCCIDMLGLPGYLLCYTRSTIGCLFSLWLNLTVTRLNYENWSFGIDTVP